MDFSPLSFFSNFTGFGIFFGAGHGLTTCSRLGPQNFIVYGVLTNSLKQYSALIRNIHYL